MSLDWKRIDWMFGEKLLELATNVRHKFTITEKECPYYAFVLVGACEIFANIHLKLLRKLCSHPGRCPRWSRRMRWAWRWCPLWGPPRPGSWWTCWTPSAAASRSWPHHICIVHYILTPSYLMAWSTIPLPTAVTLDSSSSARPSTSRWGWE